MTRVKALRESIKHELGRVCGIPFYDDSARPAAKPPFGVCSLLLMLQQENWDVYDLFVNISDYSTDEEMVDALSETVLDHLYGLDYFGENGTNWSAYDAKCRPIESADKNIKQRRISATIKYYRKD